MVVYTHSISMHMYFIYVHVFIHMYIYDVYVYISNYLSIYHYIHTPVCNIPTMIPSGYSKGVQGIQSYVYKNTKKLLIWLIWNI